MHYLSVTQTLDIIMFQPQKLYANPQGQKASCVLKNFKNILTLFHF